MELLWGHDVDWWNSSMLWSLFVGAVAGIGVLVFTTGSVLVNKKQAKADSDALERYKIDERGLTATLENQTARLSAEAKASEAQIADANKIAAEANARALEAKLELAKFKAPRILTPEQQQRIADKLKRFAGINFDAAIGPMGDPEPLYILRSINSALSLAKWTPVDWTAGGQTYTEAGLPTIGLTMVTNIIVDVHPSRWDKFGAAAQALAAALNAEGIDAIADRRSTSINSDAIHLRIGRKL